jgi:hypothetical protein
MVLNAAGAPTSIAVGAFQGGGFEPQAGQAPPSPPAPPVSYNDVPVLVNYSNATYEPFVVKQIVDVGDDPAVGGRKVLLDGVTPAWGEWTQSDSGERQFVVHQTQQYPGISDPGEGPLPGNYQLQLAAASSPTSSGLSTNDIILISAAVVLAACAVGLPLLLGRRHRPRH